jgi:hypothetical protein
MPPSAAVHFVEETTRDGLAEGEVVLLSKREHALHSFLSPRLGSHGWRLLHRRFLSEGKDICFQRHAAGMSARKETRFNLWPQVKSDGHGNLSSILRQLIASTVVHRTNAKSLSTHAALF